MSDEPTTEKVHGVLCHGVILETDDGLVAYTGGTRVIIQIDDTLPSLIFNDDVEEVRDLIRIIEDDDDD